MSGRGRSLALACAGLAGSAALMWGASALVWYRGAPQDRGTVEITGAQAAPALGGLALLALAGVAAVVATGGVVRRVLGLVLGAAGLVAAGLGAGASWVSSFALGGELTAAPWLAVAGGVVLVLVGVFVLVREPALARFGTRFAAAAGTARPELDPDRSAWSDLDAGVDPTVEAPAGPPGDPTGDASGAKRDDPGSGSRTGSL